VEHFLSSWGYLALVLLTFAEAACVPIPSEVTLGYAGYLASTGRLDLAAVAILGVAGEVLGSLVGWSIGRFGGRPLVDKLGRYVLLTSADLDRTERWFRKRGGPAVLIGRVLPVVRTFISIPAGFAEMGLVGFVAATFAGSAIWCTTIALVGYELGGEWTRMTKGFSYAGYVLVAIAVVVVAAFIFHRLAAMRRERDGLSN
jgi:membrane protein DedA with SNARE-associated domain